MTRPSDVASLLPAAALLLTLGQSPAALAQPAVAPPAHSFDIALGQDAVHVEFTAADTLHVQFRAAGRPGQPSVVIDRGAPTDAVPGLQFNEDADQLRLRSPLMEVTWNKRDGELSIGRVGEAPLLRQLDLPSLGRGQLSLLHAKGEPMYGIGGYNATEDASAGLLRNGRQIITAGEQGHAGAPFVWSTAGYGVLLDGVGGQFNLADTRIDARMFADNLDYYVFVGAPKAIFGALARVSGHSPLFPKWAMGFTNSQWGIDQPELLDIVRTYRARHIPIDNFTLDFDWKAWGEDNYGEFRWNPVKFPGGPTGELKQLMDRQGMHMTGIMKPRLHVDTVEGRYATAHDLWYAGQAPAPDYFSHKPVRDIDFTKPTARAWFFNDALKHSFDTGMIGWWNDEADDTPDDLQFLDMERALYVGQRAYSKLRVWSLNRNFYLGAQRYAYGLWSGDIPTGFASMAAQRQRMLSAVNVGAMQWGMDGGGFKGGTPTPENYARWIQFGAFTPIFRVHGELGQKRQPWVYGPVAEKAATAAIRLRYALIPYIYSYEYRRHVSGVGLVRPLVFDWPHDPAVRNDSDAWLFGDYLLASPVVEQGQTAKDVYLPAGQWTDWASGKVYPGGQTAHLPIDSQHWSDLPLFVREGAIIPMQPPMDYVGERPLTELTVEVFPAAERSTFDYYDDDGSTYGYEHGQYFLQPLAAQRAGSSIRFETGKVEGAFRPALAFYLLHIHADPAKAVHVDGRALAGLPDLDALRASHGEGWASGHDRFGAVTYVRVAAGKTQGITLDLKP